MWHNSSSGPAAEIDPRVLVGLGGEAGMPRARVQWPDGRTEEWAVEVGRYTTLVQGTGR